jgi:hypothetical protein
VQAIKLGRNQRHHLDAINAQPVDRAVDIGVDQQHAAHPGAAEIHLAEGRAGHGQVGELHRPIVGGPSDKIPKWS